jgi:hypothetical protein
MRQLDKFVLAKIASSRPTALKAVLSTGTAGATAAMLPFVPWNTIRDIKHNLSGTASQDELPQSVSSDLGRGIGGALGASAAMGLNEAWHVPATPWLRALTVLGGTGIGATLGHMKGRNVGRELFPGSLHDRIMRAANNL